MSIAPDVATASAGAALAVDNRVKRRCAREGPVGVARLGIRNRQSVTGLLTVGGNDAIDSGRGTRAGALAAVHVGFAIPFRACATRWYWRD